MKKTVPCIYPKEQVCKISAKSNNFGTYTRQTHRNWLNLWFPDKQVETPTIVRIFSAWQIISMSLPGYSWQKTTASRCQGDGNLLIILSLKYWTTWIISLVKTLKFWRKKILRQLSILWYETFNLHSIHCVNIWIFCSRVTKIQAEHTFISLFTPFMRPVMVMVRLLQWSISPKG